jgi:hypothetical protein
MTGFGEPVGQGWLQFEELGLTLLLSARIGLEREIGQKSAGLRTYTLVGLASNYGDSIPNSPNATFSFVGVQREIRELRIVLRP